MSQLQGGYGTIPPKRTPAEWEEHRKREREGEASGLLESHKGDALAALSESVRETQYLRAPGAMCDELGLAIVGLEGEVNRAWEVARYLEAELKAAQAPQVPPSHRPFMEEAEKLRAEVERLKVQRVELAQRIQGLEVQRDGLRAEVKEQREEVSRLTLELENFPAVRLRDRISWTDLQWAVARAAAVEVGGRMLVPGETLELTIRVGKPGGP
jgi:hypothetical protein